MNKNMIKASLPVLGGLVVGAVSGYFFAKKKFETKYQRIADEEINSVKAAYSLRTKQHYLDKETAAQDLQNMRDLDDTYSDLTKKYVTEDWRKEALEDPDEIPEEEVHHNVFIHAKDGAEIWLPDRDDSHPYIITVNEYMEGDERYDQTSISYFPLDDVLVDERDEIIDDVEGTVGTDNIQNFGLGSEDESIVYVRNERLQLEFEICHETGRYGRYKMSYDPDKPMKYPRVKKMRNERDD
jgi:hypothetical protein